MPERVRFALKQTRRILVDCERLLSRNRIFVDRMAENSIIASEKAISYGLTRPLMRPSGVGYEVRQAQPYLDYGPMGFTAPTRTRGDNNDRFRGRMAEMEQSMRIIEQAMAQVPEGPIQIADPRFHLPPKQQVYGSIEGLMNHFKLVIEGQKVPAGEVYVATEGGNG